MTLFDGLTVFFLSVLLGLLIAGRAINILLNDKVGFVAADSK
jgi:hypothetical protein